MKYLVVGGREVADSSGIQASLNRPLCATKGRPQRIVAEVFASECLLPRVAAQQELGCDDRAALRLSDLPLWEKQNIQWVLKSPNQVKLLPDIPSCVASKEFYGRQPSSRKSRKLLT